MLAKISLQNGVKNGGQFHVIKLDKKKLKKIKKTYIHRTFRDYFFRVLLTLKKFLFGVDISIFDRTIEFYKSKYGQKISSKEALEKALNKKTHKEHWFTKERKTVKDILSFYNEVHIYPFRQPYIKRFQKYFWIKKIIKLIHKDENVNILEYGCGSAVHTEKLMEICPNYNYVIADIPSVTLKFVRWKKKTYKLKYKILEISDGKIPLNPKIEKYDLIICEGVLEHTFNPYEIVNAFISTLNKGGLLFTDFINSPFGENLEIAVQQRDKVKKLLREKLISIKEIDENNKNDGCYIKL